MEDHKIKFISNTSAEKHKSLKKYLHDNATHLMIINYR
jgi:hypothetical protein